MSSPAPSQRADDAQRQAAENIRRGQPSLPQSRHTPSLNLAADAATLRDSNATSTSDHTPAASLDDDNANNESNAEAQAAGDTTPGGSAPMQKRRRVTRACDECRKKKIKCDGRQPCTHCTVYSYECTYDQPSHRRRNPAPQYVEQLETQLSRAQNLLKRMTGDTINLDNPQLDQLQDDSAAPVDSTSIFATRLQSSSNPKSPDEPDIESMIKSAGQLETDERGKLDYFGHGSTLSFMRRFHDSFGGAQQPELSGNADHFPQMSMAHRPALRADSPRMVHSPRSQSTSPDESSHGSYEELPPKDKAAALCEDALIDDSILINVVHRPTFDKQFARLYSVSVDQYNDEDRRALVLLYAIMAFGCLFSAGPKSQLDQTGYKSATDEGYKYFWVARELMDMTDCRDLTSLQAVVFMTMFLQCSAKLGTCYTYIGVALRSAVRMGLHRSIDSFGPIERETRKRVFWTIRKMDVYVTSFLGLPHFLTEDDIDQEYLAETDDENITDEGIAPMIVGECSYNASNNANYQLVEIMVRIIRRIYPLRGIRLPGEHKPRSYAINYSTIREIEASLENWKDHLPESCLPNAQAEKPMKRRQYLLRIVYAYAQIMLYRPFLHYVSAAKKDQGKRVQQRAFTCAAACVTVARNLVHLTTEMKNKGFLTGSYWFTMYATFVAFLSLIFFAMENKDDLMSHQVLHDALEARDTLSALAKSSMAADRVYRIANHYFENLPPEIMAKLNQPPMKTPRKREISEPSPKKESPTSDISVSGSRKGKRASTIPETTNDSQNSLGRPRLQPQPRHRDSRQPQHPLTMQHNAGQPSPELANLSQSPQSLLGAQSVSTADPSETSRFFPQPGLWPPQLDQSHHPSPQHQQQPQFALPSHVLPSTEFGDLSNTMFPSANPFDYPAQPMTSLEQMNYYSPRNSSFGADQFAPSGRPMEMTNMPNQSDEHMDAQYFGPVPPPYLDQFEARFSNAGAGPFPGGAMPMSDDMDQGLWAPNVRMGNIPGMNQDDVFRHRYDWGGPSNQ